jgi:hypothetical protein
VTEPFGGALPDNISLSRAEAAMVLLALDDAVDEVTAPDLKRRIERAAQVIVEKFLPDLPDL